jgi:CRP/FNR family cyclic AMP-dependent transcriptional regulator
MEQKLSSAPLTQPAWPLRFSSGFCTEDYNYLRQRALLRQVRDEAEIFSRTTRDSIFLIEAGCVRLLVTSAIGRRVLVRQCGAGAIFSQPEFECADLCAVAEGACTLLQISRIRFVEALVERPGFAVHVARQGLLAAAQTARNFADLVVGSLRSRVSAELLRLAPDAEPPVIIRPAPSHAELGQAVGATREAVTRQLGQLGFDGVIATRRREIILLDPARLRLAAAPGRSALKGHVHVGC